MTLQIPHLTGITGGQPLLVKIQMGKRFWPTNANKVEAKMFGFDLKRVA